MKDYIGEFQELPFPKERVIEAEVFDIGMKKHYVAGLTEVDVTDARNRIRKKSESGVKLSFTGWITKCIAKAASEFPIMHGMRKGRKKLVLFNDVDVAVLVETKYKDQTLPKPLIIRKAQSKSLLEITEEIRQAQSQEVRDSWEQLGEGSGSRTARLAKIFPRLPRFIRKFVYRQFRNPFFVKKHMGTVLVSSVGMYMDLAGWGISVGIYPLAFILGGISKKPGVVDDRIAIREMLPVTMMFDHDVVDGGPAARFGQRLFGLVRDCFGIDEPTQV